MALTTFSMIFLGNSADLDPIEGNNVAENAGALINTYYGASDPAHTHITTMTSDDANNNAVIEGNGFGVPETVEYDLGSGAVTTVLDFAVTVNVSISFVPGSGEPDYVGIGGIVQTAEGDLFLVMIDDDFGLGANALDDVPVYSINVTSIVSSGQNQNAAASDGQEFVTCFVRGTKISTGRGDVRIEHLRIGDPVETADNGLQPIKWIGQSKVSAERIKKNPKLRPIHISAGTLGIKTPSRDLLVSRQHRMVASSAIVQRMFGTPDVLISAIKLTALPGVYIDDQLSDVEYFHILLPEHEVIFAENTPTESFHVGPVALNALSSAATEEILELFPNLLQFDDFNPKKLQNASSKKQQKLIERCLKNNRPLIGNTSKFQSKKTLFPA